MQEIWRKAVNIGIKEGLDYAEISKIQLLNKICLIATVVALSIDLSLHLLYQNLHWTGPIASIIPLGFIYLNHKEKYLIAQALTCFFYPLIITLSASVEGASLGEFTIFFILFILTFILLENENKLRNASIIWNCLNCIGLYLYIDYTFEANPIASNTVGTIFTFLACVFVLSSIILFYQKQIARKKKENDKYLEDLQKKNLELERFAFISSHDLKVPLKNIIGFSGLISTSLKDDNIQSAEDYLNIINSNARRMDSLIEDTLEIISYDKHHSKIEIINLNDILDQVLNLLAHSITIKKVNFRKINQLPKIKAHKSEMLSCFKNLIENALKYNNSSSPCITIDCSSSGDFHYVTIKDNGIGIPEKKFDKIFEMYERLVRQDDYEGSGLGLPICKKIVEKIGGKIWVDSKVGEGSTFYLRFLKVQEEMQKKGA